MTRVPVLGVPICVLSWEEALGYLEQWSAARDSRYVCICNVHSVVTARDDAGFGEVVRAADLVTADGAPVAWMMRKTGYPEQQRINGPDLMWRFCEQAARSGQKMYLYGGQEETLAILQRRLHEVFPGIVIAGAYSPPFRALTEAEDRAVVEAINASGAGIVWVSLGCPKQERWMAEHRGRINAVMVGVGAAFDYHAGTIKRAPEWMRQRGLEWFYRLCSEPGRLWKRYLTTNSVFVLLAVRELLRRK